MLSCKEKKGVEGEIAQKISADENAAVGTESSLILLRQKMRNCQTAEEFIPLFLKTIPDRDSLRKIVSDKVTETMLDKPMEGYDWYRSEKGLEFLRRAFLDIKKREGSGVFRTEVKSVGELIAPLGKYEDDGAFDRRLRWRVQAGIFRDETKFYSIWEVDSKYPDAIREETYFWNGNEWKTAVLLNDSF